MKNKETHAGGVHYIEIYFFKFERLKIEDHGVNRFGLQEVLLICRQPPYVYTSITLVLSVSRSSLLMGTPFRLDQVYPKQPCFILITSLRIYFQIECRLQHINLRMIQAIIGPRNVFPLIDNDTFLKLNMLAHVYKLITQETEVGG